MKKGERRIIPKNTRSHRAVIILRFKLPDVIALCFEKGVLYFGRGKPLPYEYAIINRHFSDFFRFPY